MIRSRREFLATVGQGMLIAGVGYGTAVDLGLTRRLAAEEPRHLTFGARQSLVDLLCNTPLDKLQETLVAKMQAQPALNTRELVAAAALCNARAFGGEDYIGFHTLMALAPAYRLSQQMTGPSSALPVLKVIYRNASRLKDVGGGERLQPLDAAPLTGIDRAAAIQNAVHSRDVKSAEAALAWSVANSPQEGFNDLLATVEESPEVHRVVLAHRAWDMLDFVGPEQALTMLRQSVRYCVKNEEWNVKNLEPRTILAKLLDEFHLPERATETREIDDAWVAAMSRTIFISTPAQAATAAAAALAEGVSTKALGEAIAITANQLVLRDRGRTGNQIQAHKPEGSVHGDSIGVHASDSAHAWRGIAAASNPRNRVASLILAAYQVALDRTQRGGDFQNWQPRPETDDLAKITATGPDDLIGALNSAIRGQDQATACAITQKYGDSGFDSKAIFDCLRGFAVSEEGALHAEKYFWTTYEEFHAIRAPFRWGQVVALARVSASSYGQPAAGLAEAKQLLKIA